MHVPDTAVIVSTTGSSLLPAMTVMYCTPITDFYDTICSRTTTLCSTESPYIRLTSSTWSLMLLLACHVPAHHADSPRHPALPISDAADRTQDAYDNFQLHPWHWSYGWVSSKREYCHNCSLVVALCSFL